MIQTPLIYDTLGWVAQDTVTGSQWALQLAVDSSSVSPGVAETADTVELARFLTENNASSVQIIPDIILHHSQEWQIIALIVAVIFIALAKIIQKNFFQNLRAGIFSRPIFRQMYRDGVLFSPGAKFLLFVSGSIVFTTFFFQINDYYHWVDFLESPPDIINFLQVAVAFASFLLLKRMTIRFFGFVFKTKNQAIEYISNSVFFNTLSTLFLIPLMFLSVYDQTHMILFVIAGVVVVFSFVGFLRGVLIAIDKPKYALYQIFLYFCALEILPFLVIIRLIINE